MRHRWGAALHSPLARDLWRVDQTHDTAPQACTSSHPTGGVVQARRAVCTAQRSATSDGMERAKEGRAAC